MDKNISDLSVDIESFDIRAIDSKTEIFAQFEGEKPHGLGVMTSEGRDLYLGGWKSGRYSGLGILKVSNEHFYYGEYDSGNQKGYGKLQTDKRLVTGNFDFDSTTGTGIYSKNNFEYRGTFEGGVIKGFGHFIQKSNNTAYQGYFKNGEYSGEGKLTSPDRVYMGMFANNQKSGPGLETIKDTGDEYIGYWSCDQREAFGRLTREDIIYTGEWKRGLKEGSAIIDYKSKDFIYCGQVLDGLREGIGRMEAPNFSYLGTWNQNKMKGLGIETHPDGSTYFGYWKNSKKNGLGMEKGPKFNYKGCWKDGKPHGKGYLTTEAKEQLQVIFNEGQIILTSSKSNFSEIDKGLDELDYESFFATTNSKVTTIAKQMASSINQIESKLKPVSHRIQDDDRHLSQLLDTIVHKSDAAVDKCKSIEMILRQARTDFDLLNNKNTAKIAVIDDHPIPDMKTEDVPPVHIEENDKIDSHASDGHSDKDRLRGMTQIEKLPQDLVDDANEDTDHDERLKQLEDQAIRLAEYERWLVKETQKLKDIKHSKKKRPIDKEIDSKSIRKEEEARVRKLFNSHFTNLNSEIETLNKKLKESKSDSLNQKQANMTLIAQNTELETIIEKLKAQDKKSATKHKSEVKLIQDSMEEQKVEISTLKLKINELNSMLDNSKAAETTFDDLKHKYMRALVEISAIRIALDCHIREKDESPVIIRDLKQKVFKLEGDIKLEQQSKVDLEHANTDILSRLRAGQADELAKLREKAKKDIDYYKDIISKLKQQANDSGHTGDDTQGQLNADEANHLTDENAGLSKEVRDLKEQLESVQLEVMNLNKKVADKEKIISDTQVEKEEAVNKLAQLDQSVKNLELKQKEWIEIKEALANNIQILRDREQELKTELESKKDIEKEEINKRNQRLSERFFKDDLKVQPLITTNKQFLLAITADGSNLYVGGENLSELPNAGSKIYEDSIVVKLDFQIKDVRCLEDGRIAVHQAMTNNLIIYKKNFTVEKQFAGIPETYNSEAEESKSFRCTGDSRRFLWNKGGGSMAFYDVKANEVVCYENFWMSPDRRKPLMGVFGLGNAGCTKIFGSGFDSSGQVLIYHQFNKDIIFKPICAEYNSQITSWTCIEKSLDQEFIIVGGINIDTPILGLISFNDTLTPIGFTKFTKVKSRSFSRLKRIEGSNFILAGMIQELLVLRFEKNQFTVLHTYMTYSDYELSSITFHTNKIYFLTLGESELNVIEIDASVNQSEFHSAENMSSIVTEFYEMKLGLAKKKAVDTPNFQDEKEIVSYLANEDITYNIILEEEEKLVPRLNTIKVFKRLAENETNKRITANISERALYVNTGSQIDIYKIEEADTNYHYTIRDMAVHSIICVNSLIVIQELNSNNMHIYNKGKLMRAFKGLNKYAMKEHAQEHFEVKPSNSNVSFLWQSSNNSVTIMNLGDLDSQTVVDNFWIDVNDATIKNDMFCPITLVMNMKPEKILGLAHIQDKGYILKSYEIEKKKSKSFEFKQYQKELEINDPKFTIVSIDKSQRTNLFFAAVQLGDGLSKVVQVKISKEGLSTVSSVEIDLPEFTSIHRICSYQISKNDYILASGTNSLVLLKSKDKCLTIIHVFKDLTQGEIMDACICRNKFFGVSPGATYIVEAAASNKIDEAHIEKLNKQFADDIKDEVHYERYTIHKLEITNDRFTKLDVNKKGDVLYAAGRGIVAVTGINTGKPALTEIFYESSGGLTVGKKFCMLKCLRNGNILLQDAKSNDLVELSATMKEVKRIKGQPGVVLQNDSFRNSRHSHDEIILPWIKGGDSTSQISIKDLSLKEVKYFFNQDSETGVIPLTSVVAPDGDKMFGTSFFNGKMRLSVWEKSTAPKYYVLTDLFSNFGIILTTELSLEGNVLFIGGSTAFDYKKGQAIIQAVNFNKKLSYITDNLMSEAENLFVSKIKRIDSTNKILVATSKSIYIYLFKNHLFNFITIIQNLLPGGECMVDMALHNTNLFVLPSKSKTIHQIEFATG